MESSTSTNEFVFMLSFFFLSVPYVYNRISWSSIAKARVYIVYGWENCTTDRKYIL